MLGDPPDQGEKSHAQQEQAKAAAPAALAKLPSSASKGQGGACPETHQTKYDCNTVSAIASVRQADAAEWFNNLACGEIGVGLVTAIVAALAARWAKKAANAAHDANRPWIELEIVGKTALTFDDGGAHFGVTVKIHNRGNSPATNVLVFSRLLPVPVEPAPEIAIDNTAVVTAMEESIVRFRVHDRRIGTTVFPTSPGQEQHEGIATPAEIDVAENSCPGTVMYHFGLAARYRFGERTGKTIYGFTVVNGAAGSMYIQRGQAVPPALIRLDDTYAGCAT